MRFLSFLVFLLAGVVLLPEGGAASIPDPYVETSFATEGPLSLYMVPDGSGLPFTEALQYGGQTVDGTLTIVLYDNPPGWGVPIANFPFEDIWLEDDHGGLAYCVGGTSCDANTDSSGMTYWRSPLELGGSIDQAAGGLVRVVVNGMAMGSGALPDLLLNSPDIDADGRVNLSDIQQFAADFFGPYHYRSDFIWDGAVNLSDIVPLARAMGADCP